VHPPVQKLDSLWEFASTPIPAVQPQQLASLALEQLVLLAFGASVTGNWSSSTVEALRLAPRCKFRCCMKLGAHVRATRAA